MATWVRSGHISESHHLLVLYLILADKESCSPFSTKLDRLLLGLW